MSIYGHHFLFACVCTCLYGICACVNALVCMFMWYGGQRSTLSVIPQESSILFFQKNIGMEHSKKAKLSSQQVLGIFLSLPPQCGDYKQVLSCLLFICFLGAQTGSNACKGKHFVNWAIFLSSYPFYFPPTELFGLVSFPVWRNWDFSTERVDSSLEGLVVFPPHFLYLNCPINSPNDWYTMILHQALPEKQHICRVSPGWQIELSDSVLVLLGPQVLTCYMESHWGLFSSAQQSARCYNVTATSNLWTRQWDRLEEKAVWWGSP